jgi:hypothetical protein
MNPMTCREPARSTPQRQSRHAAFGRRGTTTDVRSAGRKTMPGTPAPERRPHVPGNSPIYTGHFHFWFGDGGHLRNDVEHATGNFRVTGSDGSIIAWHNNAQVAMKRQRSDHSVLQHFSMTCP